MTTLDELLSLHNRLTVMHVERWVARGLLRPTGGIDAWSFEQIDVARARLLAELADDIGFDDDTVETVIGLVDQVHTLRGQLEIGLGGDDGRVLAAHLGDAGPRMTAGREGLVDVHADII